MKFTTIIVFLIPVVVARRSHRTILENILKSKVNLYAEVNNNAQNVMNSLFIDLNLPSSFLAKSRINSLLTMHYHLNTMAEKNYEEYENIIEATRLDAGNQSTKKISLYDLIEETLDEEPFNQFVKLKEHKTSREHTKYKTTTQQQQRATTLSTETDLGNISQSDPVFANSKEFVNFVKDFIKKVDGLSERDFFKTTPFMPLVEDTMKPDLEEWNPQASDYFNDSTRRIFMGQRTTIKKFPFLVSVHLMEVFTCSGTILTNDLVITAASCLQLLHNNRFFRENPKVVGVRVGSTFHFSGGEWIPVIELYFYPTYNPKTLTHNLVLLRLLRHIKFEHKQTKLKKIRFDKSESRLAINIDGVIVAGWGSRKMSNIVKNERIMQLKLDIYPLDECAILYNGRHNQFVTERHFCAGYMSSGAGACHKDLGSPGVLDGILVGVVSFGSPLCGTINTPTVFTKVGFYANWIETIIKKDHWLVYPRTTLRTSSTPIQDFIDIVTRRTTSRPRIKPPLNMFLRNREGAEVKV